MSSDRAHVTTLRDHLHAARRRKWLIMQATLLAPVAAVIFSLRQEPLYEASAEVVIARHSLPVGVAGAPDPAVYAQPERVAQTEARLARMPAIAERTLEATGDYRGVEDLLKRSVVSAERNVDLLNFRVRDGDPSFAVRTATAYARQFTIYRREVDTAALVSARKELQERIDALEAGGERNSALYVGLVNKKQELRTLEALQPSGGLLVRPADEPRKVQPHMFRNGLLGLGLGLVLGFALAFLRETLDTRVRTSDEISERLGLPLLARLPEPSRKLRRQDGLLMIADPERIEAEQFRVLRTNLEFTTLGREVRVILVSSAVQGEGKSTTAANLAVALARTGKRVVLVDLDLRRPALHRFFGLGDAEGVTSVALGRSELERALVPVAIGRAGNSAEANGNGRGALTSVLHVLTAGPLPPSPGEFVNHPELASVLDELRFWADVVLVDTPPLLDVGDTMALSAKADALLLVARLDVLRRPLLAELHRVLEACPITKLGFVLTGVGKEERYGYGYYGTPTPADVAAPSIRNGERVR